jgi:Leucine-rich repeat (LRR) protein
MKWLLYILFAPIIGTTYSKVTINCNFERILSTYSCNPISANELVHENEEIEVNGNHLHNFKDDDITYVRFNSPLTFTYVPTKLFEIFSSIETFGLHNVNLSKLVSNAFTNCFKLKSLHIDGNENLSEVPESFAEECGSLQHLYLSGNGIESIDENAFKGLDNLYYLVLSKNKIKIIHPNTLSGLKNLQSIFLDHNSINSLHEQTFYKLRKLQTLSIKNNQIEEISSILFRNNPLLDQIFFDNNHITSIDSKLIEQIPGKRDLYEYRFSGNNCTNVILSNQLEFNDELALTECFENWNDLHQMNDTDATTEKYFEGKCRYYLNENRRYTCVIENVDLVLSAINGLHYTTFNDEHVLQLFFTNSILRKVPPIVYRKFPNLEFLSVARTKLSIIDDQTFGSCGKLKKIDASGNNIEKIVETSLKNCKQLETIDVRDNPIEFIDGDIFHFDPQLKHIILNK